MISISIINLPLHFKIERIKTAPDFVNISLLNFVK
uniref:Uncharacterized protein n=1 Tax=Myoviridae sp. ctsip2 TaxID=2826705 RepID=A0A8S5N5G4_9CAUD|nr:MAG TPA: hypothetical protein [Myoviridae sp. ctsip2]